MLAARLSEDPARRVILLEAGEDHPSVAATPDDLRDAWRMSLRLHDWGFTAQAVPGRDIPYLRGRVVDASVMPTVPRANVNLTCIMIADHVADWMRAEH